jgi:uncharacterized iron-regulated membrane protein
MKARKIFFWCHLLAGVSGGVVILIMSLTGVLLTYERQIVAWADRSYRSAPAAPGMSRLPIETLLEKFREAQPETAPATITLKADPAAPLAIVSLAGHTVYLDKYTGAVLGEGSRKVRTFFRMVTDWHRWLGVQIQNRPVARAITGACNLAFLFLVASGFYLWWPRKWSRRSLGGATLFERGLRGKARDWNWHNVIGFWSAVPLFIVVACAVVISYPWASNLVYRLAGSDPPPQAIRAGGRERDRPAELRLDGLDKLWTRAEQQITGWQSISLRLPASANGPLTFLIDRGNGGQPHKRSQLLLDMKTGEIVRWETFESYDLGRRIRLWMRWLHTGEALGLVGQTIAGIVSAGGVFLVWTGLALAWRRFWASQARVRSGKPVPAASRLEFKL